jgi:putative tricarboxylic transport membrane protein
VRERPFLRSGDFWSGLALAGLGTWIVAQARAWDYLTEEGPGPGFFPVWYGGIIVVLSLLLVAGSVLKPSATRAVAWDDVGRAMTCWVAFVACIVAMRWTGFIVAFAILTWFMARVMAAKPQRVAIPLAVGLSVFFYALFVWGLEVSLPEVKLF